MTNYADNNFIIRWEKDLVKVIPDMEKSLEAITIIELNISDFWRVCLHGLPYLGNALERWDFKIKYCQKN